MWPSVGAQHGGISTWTEVQSWRHCWCHMEGWHRNEDRKCFMFYRSDLQLYSWEIQQNFLPVNSVPKLHVLRWLNNLSVPSSPPHTKRNSLPSWLLTVIMYLHGQETQMLKKFQVGVRVCYFPGFLQLHLKPRIIIKDESQGKPRCQTLLPSWVETGAQALIPELYIPFH